VYEIDDNPPPRDTANDRPAPSRSEKQLTILIRVFGFLNYIYYHNYIYNFLKIYLRTPP
jgi:hypothetical protein